MKEVYIVTSGDYSDYSIRQVFDDKEIAEEFAAQIRGDVEVFEITNELQYAKGLRSYIVYMKKNGDTINIYPTEITDHSIKNSLNFRKSYGASSGPNSCYIYILTDKGQEGAIKIANEKRAMAIANNEWPE